MSNNALNANGENMSSPEIEFERVLRPKAFEDFTGQKKVLDNLSIFVQAALKREEVLGRLQEVSRRPPGRLQDVSRMSLVCL